MATAGKGDGGEDDEAVFERIVCGNDMFTALGDELLHSKEDLAPVGARPRYRVDLSKFERTGEVEAMLEGVAAAGAGPPVAITVARSPDGFAPLEILPSVEATILEMLERVYGGAGRELAVRHTRETAALHDLVEVVDWLPRR